MFNAIGIDVSKSKSTIAVLQSDGTVLHKPFNIAHKKDDLKKLVSYIKSLDGDTRVVLECTGRYHLPVLHAIHDAGLFISAVNPKLIKNYDNNSLRHVKTDPADAVKIANYTIDNCRRLREYSSMDENRERLKNMNTQFDFFMKQKTATTCNLISLLDLTYPGVNKFFSSPTRSDGSTKWVDFAYSFWHVDCVSKISLSAFKERYKAFCKRKHYEYSDTKAEEVYSSSKTIVASCPKNSDYKMLVQSTINQLNVISENVEKLRTAMNELASQMPEYDTVMGMYGVGTTYGPQLIAEIGDITRYATRESLTAYAGVDPGENQSGDKDQKSNHSSKCGPARLRKVLYQVISTILQNAPEDEKVYQFIDKKRSEGKPYLVYVTAGMNKFLRIYYGKVKEYYRNNMPSNDSK